MKPHDPRRAPLPGNPPTRRRAVKRALGPGLAALALLGVLPAPAQETALPAVEALSCVTCHGDPEQFAAAGLAIVESFRQDVHAAAGLSCHHCHGGNPAPETAVDFDLAMDEGFAENPYVGVPERADQPAFCGRCHSDPEYMKRFRPELRADQECEFRTGRPSAAGDAAAATCSDCHPAHGFRPETGPPADEIPEPEAAVPRPR